MFRRYLLNILNNYQMHNNNFSKNSINEMLHRFLILQIKKLISDNKTKIQGNMKQILIKVFLSDCMRE